MKKYLLVFFLFVGFQTFAQTYETINGKKYIVHEVVPKNTVYSISKQYNVSVADIFNNNPEAEKGLTVGQKIYIPTTVTAELDNSNVKTTTVSGTGVSTNNEEVKLNRFHTVGKQETLYGIAKQYNVTINDIVKLNPNIEAGIQVGQRVIIPDATNKSNSSVSNIIVYYDTIIPHKVTNQETLFSISKRYMVPQKDIVAYNGIKNNAIKPGETIYIPLKKDEYKPVEIRDVKAIQTEIKSEVPKNDFVFKKKDNYKIVVALPLGLSTGNEKFSAVATELYMGVEYALDSLQKSGLNADVYVLDCSTDTSSFKTKLTAHKDADLILGAFSGAQMDVIANFGKTHKIKVVNPLLGYTKPLQNNEFVTNAMTSDISLMEGLAMHLAKNADGKILLVKPTANDMPLYNAFRNKLQALNSVKFIECELTDFAGYFVKGVNTTIVYPSRDANSVTKFMNTLHQNSSKIGSNINVYGTKEWTSMDKVKNYYKNTYNFHFSMGNDLDYTTANTKKMVRAFRAKYNTDMTKIMAQGFDVMYYFAMKLFLDKEPNNLIMNDFNIKKISNNDGFENVSTYIYKQIDFDYILQGKIK